MDNPKIKLSKDEFDRYNVYYPSNQVIVEMPPAKDLLVAGIKINFNEDTLYGEGEGSHVADVAPVFGTIVKQVDKLYFNTHDVARSMSWDTEVQTMVGDKVWFHAFASKNCPEIEVEDKLYKVIHYEDLFIAVREILSWDDEGITVEKNEVICLNGNILLEEMLVPKISEFDVRPPEVDKTRGKVAYIGMCNGGYLAKGVGDIGGLKIGDIVSINKGAYVFNLERSKYNSTFDGGKQYICIQRRYIDAVI